MNCLRDPRLNGLRVARNAYPDVTFDGVTYDGHWSWIYVARNDPRTAKGQHVWQWMAEQSLKSGHARW